VTQTSHRLEKRLEYAQRMVAQGAHASMRAILNGARREGDVLIVPLDARNEAWLCGRFKKICVSVNSESELLKLHQWALDAGLITALIPLL
jgi:peptidyl-tRNA hydrolase, PTH2 family